MPVNFFWLIEDFVKISQICKIHKAKLESTLRQCGA